VTTAQAPARVEHPGQLAVSARGLGLLRKSAKKIALIASIRNIVVILNQKMRRNNVRRKIPIS
jgi:hypothetical protein